MICRRGQSAGAWPQNFSGTALDTAHDATYVASPNRQRNGEPALHSTLFDLIRYDVLQNLV